MAVYQEVVAAWMETLGFKIFDEIGNIRWSNGQLLVSDRQATFFYQAHVAAVAEAELRGAQSENEIWTRLAIKHQWGDIMNARRNLDIYLNQEEFAIAPLNREE